MTIHPTDKPNGIEFISNRQGKAHGLTSAADAAAYERLVALFPRNETCFIAKNAEGIYGFAVEGAEYPYEATKDAVDEDWYVGRAVNGVEKFEGEFPSLDEIVQHTAAEVDGINARYPGLGADIYWGKDTFDGHATVMAFVAEHSEYVKRAGEIGTAMLDLMEHNTAVSTAAPKI